MSYFLLRALLKFAVKKREIEQYNIGDDKIMHYFILRYENIVSWNGYDMPVLDAENKPVEDENGEAQFAIKKIENKDDINQFIHDVLLDDLYARVILNAQKPELFGKNIFVKKIDMDKLRKAYAVGVNPTFDEAYNIYLTDKEVGEKKYLDHVNGMKKTTFERWVGYIKGNETLRKEAAFCYIILSKVLDSSSSKTLSPPPSCNPVVVGNVRASIINYQEKFTGKLNTNYQDNEDAEAASKNKRNSDIQKELISWDKFQPKPDQQKETIEQIAARLEISIDDIKEFLRWAHLRGGSFVKIYQDLLTEHNEKVAKMSSPSVGGNWVKFPKKDTIQDETDENGNKITAEEIFDRNLDYLDALSQPVRWCTTKNWNGPPYLRDGDFYAFVRNGKAECAIRFVGSKIVEFAGDQTSGYYKCPTSNYKEIIPFVKQNNWEESIAPVPNGQGFYDQILKESKLNMDFFDESGNPNLQEIENFLTFIRKDPRNFKRIDLSLFNAFPDVAGMFKDACRDGWLSELRKLTDENTLTNSERLANWGQDIPDFVQEDPVFVEGLHSKLSMIYKDNPLRLREIINKFPLHWTIYPQGKDVFKQSVLNSYDNDFYWVSKAYGSKRRTAEERTEITQAQNFMSGLNSVIADFYPDLLQDEEFLSLIDAKKQNSIQNAIMRGFISDEMDLEKVDETFGNEEFANQFIASLATKIATAHEKPNTRITQDKTYTKKFIMNEIFKVAPRAMRNLPNFGSSVEKIVLSVLEKNIGSYKNFEPEFKLKKQDGSVEDTTTELQIKTYELYKNKILASHPQELYLNHGPKYFDEILLEDPEFQSAISPTDDISNLEKYIENIKFVPESYLQLLKVDPMAAQNPQVIDAYIKSRLRRGMLKRQEIIFEFKLLPDFVKNLPEVRQAYEDVVIHLLKTALPRTKYYIECKDVDTESIQNANIKQLCEERENKTKNSRTANSWYLRSKKSLWGLIGI